MDNETKLWTVAEIAADSGVTSAAIHYHIKHGNLVPALSVTVGDKVHRWFAPSDVAAWKLRRGAR